MRRGLAALFLALPVAGPSTLAADGASLYADNCAACHQAQGQGTAGLAPPLASSVLKGAGEGEARAYVPLVILNGLSGPIVSEGQQFVSAMPGHATLTDAEVAAIANQVLAGLNGVGADAPVKPEEVTAWRAGPVGHGALREMRKGFAP